MTQDADERRTYGGDGGDDLAELELVEDGGLTGRVETNHEDPHLLLGEEAAEQLREREPHLRSCAEKKRRKRRRQQSAHRSPQLPKITISPETKPPQLDPREPMPPARRSAATAHTKRRNGSDSGGHKRGNRSEIPEHLRRNEAESSGAGQTRPDSSNKFPPKSIKLINETTRFSSPDPLNLADQADRSGAQKRNEPNRPNPSGLGTGSHRARDKPGFLMENQQREWWLPISRGLALVIR
jgi:hypothetical protein